MVYYDTYTKSPSLLCWDRQTTGIPQSQWTAKMQPFRLYQSINQSNFYSANIPSVASLSGATARSVFEYKVVEAIP